MAEMPWAREARRAVLDEDALWRRCEIAWARWLEDSGHAVTPLGEATGNTTRSQAPLTKVAGRLLRSPDLSAIKDGVTAFWEVKSRHRSRIDPLTGQSQHWVDRAAFADYLEISLRTGTRVEIVLYEAPTAGVDGRWLRIDVRHLREVGHEAERRGASGALQQAWVWPVEEMEVIDGPAVDVAATDPPLLPDEGEGDPLDPVVLQPIVRRLRRKRPPAAEIGVATEPREPDEFMADGPGHWLESEPAVALDVLRRSLGIPHQPRYSVLRVGLDGVEVDDLLALMHYGIRVFIVSAGDAHHSMDATELEAFKDARLLEWADGVAAAAGCAAWIVDGQVPEDAPSGVEDALRAADDSGQVNRAQYDIVHAPHDADVVVRAGAGTGKTETMSERIVFLLATSGGEAKPGERPHDLRADEIALVTFTRESAAEMRNRIARTLLLRQRLCHSCALPVLAWMLQLGSADIATIHSLAKRIVAGAGAVVGLGPGVRVARRTLEVRDMVNRALSETISQLVDQHHSTVPAAYEWQRHVQAVWDALENNGVDLLRFGEKVPVPPDVDWGAAPGSGLPQAAVEATREAIEQVAGQVRDLCIDGQTLPTNQLVPAATAALMKQDSPPVRPYRFLFVDEFQDTDGAQMDLVLELRRKAALRLFLVGDPKQGIYRFRGAEGNAFEEMERRVAERGLPPMLLFPLTRNFRSGERLLDSLHPYFLAWGGAGLLSYGPVDRLRPRFRAEDVSRGVETQQVNAKQFAAEAAKTVKHWRDASEARVRANPDAEPESIGVLCRQNWQALAVQAAVQDLGISCEIRVGGAFFETPAVREMRVLIEAVCDPTDDAALLELCETRWATSLLSGAPPRGLPDEEWGPVVEPPMAWRSRFATLADVDDLPRDDIEPLRRRVEALRTMSTRMPALAWVTECERSFQPGACAMPGPGDDTERPRYGRCLDHLVTLMDSQFQDGATTLERILHWLRLQVATNRTEDEPDAETDGKVVALTVHKAKGAEYDRVVIAHTMARFGPPQTLATQTAVLRDGHGGRPKVLWKWKPTGGGAALTNVPLAREPEWRTDDKENVMEETRLLYVAMTRAREELVVQLSGSGARLGSPESWGDLVRGAR